MGSITDTGYSSKTLNEYLIEIQQAHLAIDPGWNINPESTDGQRIAIDAELMANLEEILGAAYNAVDPRTAIGQQLDRLAAISGIDRQAATSSTVTLAFVGADDTVIPGGTEARNSVTGTLWATDASATIADGFATVGATCTTAGAEQAGAGNINALASPVGGVTAVVNVTPAIPGRDAENDAQFRVRRNLSVAKPGNNQVDSMFAEVANVDGVSQAKIYENFEAVADANGLDGHSIMVIAQGGTNKAVAAAIAASKNPGCGLNATNTFANKQTVATETPMGNPFTATFYRPEESTIYVDVAVTGSGFPSDIDEQIKQAIVDYATASLFSPAVGFFDETGFQIGEVIAAGKLYTAVNKVVAANGYVTSILIGDAAGDINYQTVDPGFNGIGMFDPANITVTIT